MAINPLPFLQNMPDPGQAFLQAFQQARQQRDQQIAQQTRQAQYAQWVQRLQQDRSPEALSQFMLTFPEMSDTITKAFAPLDEAQKQARLGYTTQVYSALERGDTQSAKAIAQNLFDAAKNTPGQEQFAKELEFGIKQIDTNPEPLKVGLANAIFTMDPERYKAMYDSKGSDTTLIKNLVAEGLKPGTEEFKQALRDERTKVTITDPRIGFFSGPADEFRRRFGGEPPADAQRGPLPSPKSKAEFDALPPGTQFKAPDGTIRTKPGGASSNAGGGFPGGAR